jgi:hypothetical protein
MKKTVFSFVAIIFLLFCISPAYAQKIVRAKGSASIQKNFVDIARTKAIDEAQRNAVEQAVGVMVSSATNVENYQVKLDRILSESNGFINKYAILDEKRIQDSYEVEIEAEVSTNKLQNKMAAINLIMVRKAKPRLMMVFADQSRKTAVAHAAMAKYFMSHGFKLIDAQTIRKNKDYELLSDAAEKKKISGIAHRLGAEIIIIGTVETESNAFKINDIEMNNNKVVVSGKVINGDTGEIITTGAEQKSAPGMKGNFKALTDEVATKLARNLVDDVLDIWSSELTNTTTIKLVISGLKSLADLQSFKALVTGEVKGCKGINQRYYSRGRAELDLDIAGDVQAVAHDISEITVDKRKIEILEVSQNRVEAVLRP